MWTRVLFILIVDQGHAYYNVRWMTKSQHDVSLTHNCTKLVCVLLISSTYDYCSDQLALNFIESLSDPSCPPNRRNLTYTHSLDLSAQEYVLPNSGNVAVPTNLWIKIHRNQLSFPSNIFYSTSWHKTWLCSLMFFFLLFNCLTLLSAIKGNLANIIWVSDDN